MALEALSGELPLAALARKDDVYPRQITGWKRQAKEGMVAAFSKKAANVQKDAAAEIRELHAKIGELTKGISVPQKQKAWQNQTAKG